LLSNYAVTVIYSLYTERSLEEKGFGLRYFYIHGGRGLGDSLTKVDL